MSHYQQTIHFPYQNAYLGVFMNDFDQPGDFYFPRSVRFHINKMGQKKYQRIHLGKDNLIKGDEIDILHRRCTGAPVRECRKNYPAFSDVHIASCSSIF